jgi:hypothetical protein
VKPYNLIGSSISEELVASIFRVEYYRGMIFSEETATFILRVGGLRGSNVSKEPDICIIRDEV